jgi:vacuolar protein 8
LEPRCWPGTRAPATRAAALTNLARNADNRVTIAAAGAIEPLVALVRGGSEGAKEAAAAALRTLASNNDDNKVAMARLGYTP